MRLEMKEERNRIEPQERSSLLRELLADSHYVIDESAVAEAILTRVRARALIPGVMLGGARAHPLAGAMRRTRAPRVMRPARGTTPR
jgi:hypothetical protein